MDTRLGRLVEDVGHRFMLTWLGGIPSIRRLDVGPTVATAAPDRPELDFQNTVRRFRPGAAGAIARFYGPLGIRPWFEGDDTLDVAGTEVVEELARLAGPVAAEEDPRPRDGVRVEQTGGAAIDVVTRTLAEGHGVPADELDGAVSQTRHFADVASWLLYLAWVDDQPAAAAVLAVDGDTAYFANASTLPPFRNRGCQSALIAARMHDARAARCTTACSLAAPTSASFRNLTRAGLDRVGTTLIRR